MRKVILKGDVFDRFIKACAKARKPNKALLSAVAFAKKVLGNNEGV